MSKLNAFLFFATLLFIMSCDDDEPTPFDYAETGFYGDNVLYPDRTVLTKRENSLYCKVRQGQTLSITITGKTSSRGGSTPDGGITMPSGIWYYNVATANNWAIRPFDKETFKQTFTSIDELTSDLSNMFDHCTYVIEYFENGAMSPTASKTLTFGN